MQMRIRELLADEDLGARHETLSLLAERLLALVEELGPPPPPKERLMVRALGRIVFLELDQIDWIEAEGNYARLHIGTESYLMRETMNHLLMRLGENGFFRIHRSRIVNLAKIKELRVAGGGDYSVVLSSGLRLGLSRLYKDALQARLVRRPFAALTEGR